MKKEYYDAQIRYINEIRSIRHDIQAHMIVLQYFLESENYEKAKSYLEDMKQHQCVESFVVKDMGNDLVNAIVTDTLSRSNTRIELNVDGILPEDFVLTEYDVCTLFSNLFSNAREACEKLERIVPAISVKIWEDDTECFIAVQNPIEWKIQTDGAGLLTSKKDKKLHGLGTRNMIKVVKQYHGKIDFLITEKTFGVEIVLPRKRSDKKELLYK